MYNKENNSPLSGGKRYSVALVFTRQTQVGSIETMLRNLVCYAKSEKEALGDAIQYFEEESKGFGLICKCVIQIYEQSRISELEKELLIREGIIEMIGSSVQELEASNAKMRDVMWSLKQFLYNEIIERRNYSASKSFEIVLEQIEIAEQSINGNEK